MGTSTSRSVFALDLPMPIYRAAAHRRDGGKRLVLTSAHRCYGAERVWKQGLYLLCSDWRKWLHKWAHGEELGMREDRELQGPWRGISSSLAAKYGTRVWLKAQARNHWRKLSYVVQLLPWIIHLSAACHNIKCPNCPFLYYTCSHANKSRVIAELKYLLSPWIKKTQNLSEEF